MNRKIMLGKRLRELRKRQKISQEKLAELIEVDPTTISNIENGKNYPSMMNLEKIISILNVNFSDVFDFEHKDNIENLKTQIFDIMDENPEKIEDIYKVVIALTK